MDNEQFYAIKKQISATGYDLERLHNTNKEILQELKNLNDTLKTIKNRR